MPNGPYQDDPRSPIAGITFLDMQVYLGWLNERTGTAAYRLPTEVEWEYAALAGATTVFSQGDRLTRDRANFAASWLEVTVGNHEWHYDPKNEGRPISVDRLDAAYSWGLRHTSGNVSEMTLSRYTDHIPGFDTASRFLAATYRPLGCRRVTKGGAYIGHVELTRPERRRFRSEDDWAPWLGFRVLRELGGAPDQPGATD